MMRKQIITLLAACLLATGCKSAADSTATDLPPEKAVAVNVANAYVKELQKNLAYPGQVKASEQLPVAGKLSGKVDKVFFSQGDAVKAGDILYTMDTADLQNNVKTLESQLETSETAVRTAQTGVELAGGSQIQLQLLQSGASVNQAETGLEQAKRNIEQAQLTLEQRELSYNQAQTAYDNAAKTQSETKILFDVGGVPKSQLEQADTALKNAESALEQARSVYEQAKNSLNLSVLSEAQAKKTYEQALENQNIVSNVTQSEGLRKAQDALAQATAQRNGVLVNLEIAKEKLNDASVRSPINGIISARSVEEGAMITTAAVPFMVARTDIVEIKVNVTEMILNKLSEGQKVSVSISAASDKPYTGEIDAISPVANEASAAFEVKIAIPNKDNAIKPGMYAEAYFVRERAENALVLPRSAVMTEGGTSYVYIVYSDAAKKQEITTGLDTGEEIQITAGLDAAANVVVKGQKYLKDGMKVKIEDNGGK